MTASSSTKQQKALAATAAVDDFLSQFNLDKELIVLGIGSGSTIVHVVSYLASQIKELNLNKSNLLCIPSSFQAKQLIIKHQFKLGSLEQYHNLHLTIDGADAVDKNLDLVKGGGGCHLMEKLVAYASKRLFIVCDESKQCRSLLEKWDRGIPIEVVPAAWSLVSQAISKKFEGSRPYLREAKNKAGPVVTDCGNFILDIFPKESRPWQQIETELRSIPGVICTGLFLGMADKVFVGKKDGTVEKIEK